jgi:hypothetical protein
LWLVSDDEKISSSSCWGKWTMISNWICNVNLNLEINQMLFELKGWLLNTSTQQSVYINIWIYSH